MVGDDSEPGRALERQLRKGRLEAFSDGVFAIAVTLLVLEITVPDGSEDDLLGAVVDQWPSYLGYVAAFSTIGLVWIIHSAITEYLDRVDAVFVRLNLLLLMMVSFLPFPTRLLAEYLGEDDAARVASTAFGLTLLAVAVLVALVWRYAVHRGLLRSDADDDEIRTLTVRLTPGLGGYVGTIIVGLFVPTVAVIGYLTITAALLVVPLFTHKRAHA